MLGEVLSFAFLVQDINYLHIYMITTNGKKKTLSLKGYVKNRKKEREGRNVIELQSQK